MSTRPLEAGRPESVSHVASRRKLAPSSRPGNICHNNNSGRPIFELFTRKIRSLARTRTHSCSLAPLPAHFLPAGFQVGVALRASLLFARLSSLTLANSIGRQSGAHSQTAAPSPPAAPSALQGAPRAPFPPPDLQPALISLAEGRPNGNQLKCHHHWPAVGGSSGGTLPSNGWLATNWAAILSEIVHFPTAAAADKLSPTRVV